MLNNVSFYLFHSVNFMLQNKYLYKIKPQTQTMKESFLMKIIANENSRRSRSIKINDDVVIVTPNHNILFVD